MTTFAAMIGLGVGIDYSLLVITRFREGLHSGRTVNDSVAIAVDTAGRSVLFAGLVVMIAMLGLNAIGIPFVGALGTAAAIVVGMSILAAVTLLPAVLSILGHNVDRLTIPFFASKQSDHHESVWYRLSHAIQRRPIIFAAAAFALLAVLIVPFFSLSTGFADAGNNSPELHSTARVRPADRGLRRRGSTPRSRSSSTSRAARRRDVDAVSQALAADPGIASVKPPILNEAGNTAIITAYPTTSPQDEATTDLVHHLRDDVMRPLTADASYDVYLAGTTATTIDFSGRVGERTAAVLRHRHRPERARADGRVPLGGHPDHRGDDEPAVGRRVLRRAGGDLPVGLAGGPLGIDQTGPIESFLPMMLFAILFGLSMDYEVFLVSRIREEYVGGRDTSNAIAIGLSSTARVITSAALIMIAVFGSFVLGDERIIKMFGIGLATAIFIDATIVRLLLLPAVMELLGGANWWLPRRLAAVIPHISVDGPSRAPEPAPVIAD